MKEKHNTSSNRKEGEEKREKTYQKWSSKSPSEQRKAKKSKKKVVTFLLCVQCADNIHRAAVAAARKNDENGKQ